MGGLVFAPLMSTSSDLLNVHVILTCLWLCLSEVLHLLPCCKAKLLTNGSLLVVIFREDAKISAETMGEERSCRAKQAHRIRWIVAKSWKRLITLACSMKGFTKAMEWIALTWTCHSDDVKATTSPDIMCVIAYVSSWGVI